MRSLGALAATVILGASALPLAAAHATVLFPSGTPVGTAMDTLTLSGTYDTPLPTPLAQPFAAVPFTLILTLPAEVTISSQGIGFLIPVAGSYSNGGQTEKVSGLSTFDIFSKTDALDLMANNLLISGDVFNLFTTNVAPLYQPAVLAASPQTAVGLTYQLTTATISNASGSATYSPFGDPNFSGTITVTAAVPEPSSWLVLSVGVMALGAAVAGRRARFG